MYVVVTYDVVGDSRRTRLRKRLCGFLTPVQKSVFEGDLPAARLPALLETIRKNILHRKDDVRVYVLCKGCQGSTVLLGIARPVGREEGPVIP